MQRPRAIWPNWKNNSKNSILEKGSGKLHFPTHCLIYKFKVFQSCHVTLGLLHFHLLLYLETETLLSDFAVIFLRYVIFFFYIQLAFAFHLQGDFCSVLDNVPTFCLFLLQKDFDTFRVHINDFLKKLMLLEWWKVFYIYLKNNFWYLLKNERILTLPGKS